MKSERRSEAFTYRLNPAGGMTRRGRGGALTSLIASVLAWFHRLAQSADEYQSCVLLSTMLNS